MRPNTNNKEDTRLGILFCYIVGGSYIGGQGGYQIAHEFVVAVFDHLKMIFFENDFCDRGIGCPGDVFDLVRRFLQAMSRQDP